MADATGGQIWSCTLVCLILPSPSSVWRSKATKAVSTSRISPHIRHHITFTFHSFTIHIHIHNEKERRIELGHTRHDIDDTREVRISLEVSRFLESNLNGVGSDSHFDWKCPGIGLPFLRNRLTYSLNGIPWSCLCSDSYLPRIAPELELRF